MPTSPPFTSFQCDRWKVIKMNIIDVLVLGDAFEYSACGELVHHYLSNRNRFSSKQPAQIHKTPYYVHTIPILVYLVFFHISGNFFLVFLLDTTNLKGHSIELFEKYFIIFSRLIRVYFELECPDNHCRLSRLICGPEKCWDSQEIRQFSDESNKWEKIKFVLAFINPNGIHIHPNSVFQVVILLFLFSILGKGSMYQFKWTKTFRFFAW